MASPSEQAHDDPGMIYPGREQDSLCAWMQAAYCIYTSQWTCGQVRPVYDVIRSLLLDKEAAPLQARKNHGWGHCLDSCTHATGHYWAEEQAQGLVEEEKQAWTPLVEPLVWHSTSHNCHASAQRVSPHDTRTHRRRPWTWPAGTPAAARRGACAGAACRRRAPPWSS